MRDDLLRQLARRTVDLVLTSPPYVNAIDYPRAHKFSEWWLSPDNEQCKRANYVGLRGLGNQRKLIDDAVKLAPASMKTLLWLERRAPAKYRLVCKYVHDMAEVIRGCRRALRVNGHLIFVLADNKVEQRTIPVIKIVKELLKTSKFRGVISIRRRIKNGRRRYPFGFEGVMKSEAIITATKL